MIQSTPQLFLAIEDDQHLEITGAILLDVFRNEDDGIFETPEQWEAFVDIAESADFEPGEWCAGNWTDNSPEGWAVSFDAPINACCYGAPLAGKVSKIFGTVRPEFYYRGGECSEVELWFDVSGIEIA